MGRKLSASIFALLACASMCAWGASAQRRGRRPAPRASSARASDLNRQTDARVAQAGDAYLRGHYAFNPSEATAAGLHELDSKLEERSPEAIAAESRRLKGALAELARTPEWRLSSESRYDFLVLQSHARARLLELEEIRMWRR